MATPAFRPSVSFRFLPAQLDKNHAEILPNGNFHSLVALVPFWSIRKCQRERLSCPSLTIVVASQLGTGELPRCLAALLLSQIDISPFLNPIEPACWQLVKLDKLDEREESEFYSPEICSCFPRSTLRFRCQRFESGIIINCTSSAPRQGWPAFDGDDLLYCCCCWLVRSLDYGVEQRSS